MTKYFKYQQENAFAELCSASNLPVDPNSESVGDLITATLGEIGTFAARRSQPDVVFAKIFLQTHGVHDENEITQAEYDDFIGGDHD